MGLELNYIKGQTPIEEEEKEELKIKTISTRGELDEFEQANIEKAIEWSMKTKFTYEQILTIGFIKGVHKKMFSDVWGWAGSFRKTNKNIGVDKYSIEQELWKLLDDCKFWIENKTFPDDELAIRFKHRMVKIHPFPNGNGRHSRLCADILISKAFKNKVFTWGSKNLSDQSDTRAKYLSAIYEADKENIKPLLEFARS
ncbi:MAG: mobile mystery protein B [Bacteroidales bacterium]|nr:mobile mystery protein B [Bacteroidales bacterium]MCF8389071.1 mobile mystery protein B [Bacteroidales bacterium]